MMKRFFSPPNSGKKIIQVSLQSGILLILFLIISTCRTVPASEKTQTLTDSVKPIQSTASIIPTLFFTPTIHPTTSSTSLPQHVNLGLEDVAGMTIRVWHAQQNETKSKLEELVNQFNSENEYGFSVSLHNELSDSILNDVLMTPPPANEFPNIVIAGSPWLKSWQAAKFPMVMLQTYIDHPTYGFEAQGIPPVMDSMLSQEYYRGNLTALPLWHLPEFLFYNDTFGQILGFSTPPANRDDFTEQICAALAAVNSDSDPDNDGTGGWILTSSPGAVISWMMTTAPQKADFSNFPEEKDRDLFTETVTWLRALFDQGCVWQSRLSEPFDYFANHNALLYSGTFADIPFQRRAFENADSNRLDDWTLIPYPLNNSDNENSSVIFSTAVSAGIFTGTAEEQFASWLFLSWLMKPENLTELALAANAWPVQDTPEITKMVKEKADSKIYASLKWRTAIQPSPLPADWNTDSLVLSDGFAYAFSPGMNITKIPEIWDQIESTLTEIKQVDQQKL